MNLLDRIEHWESQIRTGQGAKVRLDLKQLRPSEIPRELRLKVANIARRVGVSGVALRLLNPLVRSERSLDTKATDAEIAEYAVALIFVGAVHEARSLLNAINVAKTPEALLYKSFIEFGYWNYRETIPWLQKYVSMVEPESYAHWIGLINLTAAQVFVAEDPSTSDLIQKVLQGTKARGNVLLHGNALELAAQYAISQKDFALASKFLSQASEKLEGVQSLSDFFVQKWTAIVGVKKDPNNIEFQDRLRALAREALRLRHWETLREADLYLSISTKDENLFNKVWFGTPSQAYREKMARQKPADISVLDLFTLDSGSAARSNNTIIDVEKGTDQNGTVLFKAGQKTANLLIAITRDLYKPRLTGSLFAALYPNEYFSPINSPNRVHQAVRRAREKLDELQLNLDIDESSGHYSPILGEGCSLQLRLENKPKTASENQLQLLKNVFGAQDFSAKQACEKLSLSRSSFLRLISSAEEAKQLERKSAGPHTRYRLKSSAA